MSHPASRIGTRVWIVSWTLLAALMVVGTASVCLGVVPGYDCSPVQAVRAVIDYLSGVPDTAIGDTTNQSGVPQTVIVFYRLPVTLAAMLAGAALGLSGALSQGIFRNALAAPSVIGVTSGGGLGGVLAILTGWPDAAVPISVLFLTIPAAVALVVIPVPLIAVLFERGEFQPTDTTPTAYVLAIYGLGLPAFVLQKVLQPLYFAREDTRTPFRFALHSMVINAALAIGLAPLIGFSAAAWGTTLSGWAMTLQLWFGARRLGEAAQPDDRFRKRLPRTMLAAGLMGLCLWAMSWLMGDLLGQEHVRILALFVLVLGGMASFAVAALLTGAIRPSDLRAGLSRQR